MGYSISLLMARCHSTVFVYFLMFVFPVLMMPESRYANFAIPLICAKKAGYKILGLINSQIHTVGILSVSHQTIDTHGID